MDAGKHKTFGMTLKLFLILDFLVLLLSFVGTAQFANECYQLMSFAGLAAAFGWFFSLSVLYLQYQKKILEKSYCL